MTFAKQRLSRSFKPSTYVGRLEARSVTKLAFLLLSSNGTPKPNMKYFQLRQLCF